MQHPESIRWGIVGGGNMARAIVTGGLAAGILTSEQVAIAEPDVAKHQALRSLTPHVVHSASELVQYAGASNAWTLILAVKPQMLGAVAAELRPVLDAQASPRTIVSILAGTPTTLLECTLGPGAAVIRVMPNTPCMIRQGTTAYCAGASAARADPSPIVDLFRALGPVVEHIDESLMDAFTGVAGSGPAYLFYLAQAMVRGAVECGFEPHIADRIVRQTLLGAAGLLAADTASAPQELRAQVTSKGGTTAAATAVLDDHAVMESMVRAIVAARDRGAQLAQA